ncbi:MAG: hypothetical protein IPL61_33305 [Myxococcales bacterium]|nr:hypothetical protein [Myxococcales bacterium]
MSYRDDVEALFQRARSLQAEVDRLQAALAARPAADAPVARMTPPPARPPRIGSPPPRVERAPVLADGIIADVERALRRSAWLPPQDEAAAVAATPVEPGRDDPYYGVLVARLTETEYVLMMRVLDLLADDDFRPAAVARNQAAFDQLAAELRARLARPG